MFYVSHYCNFSQMNFDTSTEQDEFISKVNNACRNLRESEERA